MNDPPPPRGRWFYPTITAQGRRGYNHRRTPVPIGKEDFPGLKISRKQLSCVVRCMNDCVCSPYVSPLIKRLSSFYRERRKVCEGGSTGRDLHLCAYVEGKESASATFSTVRPCFLAACLLSLYQEEVVEHVLALIRGCLVSVDLWS